MVKQNFYIIGDPQIGDDVQETRMKKKTKDVLSINDKNGIIIIPGDLTNFGLGSMDPITKYLCMCYPYRKHMTNNNLGSKNELKELIDEHLNPLKDKYKHVLMCVGNHDSLTQWWTGYNPVFNYVKQECGGLIFEKEINGIMIYSLSQWPKMSTSDWLSKRLALHSKPFVLFFHYNLQGPFSDWWTDKEKNHFYKVIKPHKNRILFVSEGHIHSSYVKEWNGIKVVNGAGNQAMQVLVDTDNMSCDVNSIT
jgi:hypothetical protein